MGLADLRRRDGSSRFGVDFAATPGENPGLLQADIDTFLTTGNKARHRITAARNTSREAA
jgi:hypothetical protein